MSSRAPLSWRSRSELSAAPPSGNVISTDIYDWWHFRRLEAHEPTLFRRLARDHQLIPLAFDLYAALYKPRWRLKKEATVRLSAAIGYLLERRGLLHALRQKTVLNEWATVVALPLLLKPLFEALSKARRKDNPGSGAGGSVVAQLEGNRAVGRELKAYECACTALAEFDARHGLDALPADAKGGPARSLSKRVEQPPLRRRHLTQMLRTTGRPELLQERTRLTQTVEQCRASVRKARDGRGQKELVHALAVAFGDDPEMNAAVTAASTAVDEAMALVASVRHLFEENDRWGRERGSMYALPLDLVFELGNMLRTQPSLRKIVELAGRWSVTLKRRFPRGHSRHGRHEVVGVETGGDVHRLLPSELSLLGRRLHPLLRIVALARIVERRALLWELRGPHLLGRGPVIVVVDTSGSMEGPRVLVAKALVLALALRCWEKRRPMHVLTFGSATELSEFSLRPDDEFGPRIRRCLRIAFGGGTDFDSPLERVAQLCEAKPWSQADAIFITDGHCTVNQSTVERINAVKRARGLEIIGVLVAAGSGLERVADHTFRSEPGNDDGALPDALLARLSNRL